MKEIYPTSPDDTNWFIYGDSPKEQWDGVLHEAELEDLVFDPQDDDGGFEGEITRLRVMVAELREQLDTESLENLRHRQGMKDITAPEHGVQIQISADGSVLWVHVDGLTVLRICRIPQLDLEDGR